MAAHNWLPCLSLYDKNEKRERERGESSLSLPLSIARGVTRFSSHKGTFPLLLHPSASALSHNASLSNSILPLRFPMFFLGSEA